MPEPEAPADPTDQDQAPKKEADEHTKEGENPPSERFPIAEAMALAKAALWPVVALVAILFLGEPLGQVISSLPTITTRIESIDYGNFKLNLATTSERPPRVVRRALGTLTEDDIERILVMRRDAAAAYCPNVMPPSEETERLISRGILEVVSVRIGTHCDSATKLTDTGERVREYIMDLVFSQVIEPAPESVQPETPTEENDPDGTTSDH